MFNWLKDKFTKKDKDGEKEEEILEKELDEDQEGPEEEVGEDKPPLSEVEEEEPAEEFVEEEVLEEEVSEDESITPEVSDQEPEDLFSPEEVEEPEEKAQEPDVPEEEMNEEELKDQAQEEFELGNPEEDLEEKDQEPEISEEKIEVEEVENRAQEEPPAGPEEESEDSSQEEEDLEAFQEEEKLDFFQKLKSGLNKTRKTMGRKINQVLGAYVKIDDDLLEDLEDVLISSDLGMETTMEAIDRLREKIVEDEIRDPQEVLPALGEVLQELLDECQLDHSLMTEKPTVILVVGVNGVGKTTTIGKLSARLKSEGKSVLIGAADTFRAAAIDQVKTWGQRAHVDVVSHSEGADPAAVTFDAVKAAKARDVDVLIIDTAGRLHNKTNLMNELEKISRIIDREYPEAHRENLLVLDATTGQNAISQAKTFNEVTNLSGFVLTKLDGTAKGGVVIGLQRELKVPIKLVGVGEKINDLQYFDSKNFTQALFAGEELGKSE